MGLHVFRKLSNKQKGMKLVGVEDRWEKMKVQEVQEYNKDIMYIRI